MTDIEVALAGEWSRWSGLEPELHIGDLAARYGLVGEGNGTVQELVPPPPLTAWRAHIDDAGRVLLIQLDDPTAPDGAGAVLRALGEADLSQPARLQRYGVETMDHVYCARGLALVSAIDYEHGLPGEDPDRALRLIRAELFAPVDVAGWQARWGQLGAPRPPLRF
jgi:hypothetical protein